jgi:hypothetical protein
MNQELICKWLKLPGWPCDDYTLLGLAAGAGTTEEIESRVLERMELLRRYQLTHADIVTEAMNRLAQAMIRLTDPATRADYDRSLGLLPAVPAAATPETAATTESAASAVADTPDGTSPFTEDDLARLVPLPSELDAASAASAEPAATLDTAEPAAIPVGRLEQLPRARIPEPPSPPLPQPMLAAPADDAASAATRRQLYRELTRCRRMLRAWQACEQQLAHPQRPFNRHNDGPVLLTNLRTIRQTLPMLGHLLGGPAQPGYAVVQLARQPLAVQTFRGLLPTQRQALADDWKAGLAALEARYRQLRRRLRPNRLRRSRELLRTLRRLRDLRVELVLAMVGMLALCIAAGRTWMAPW